MRQKGAVLSNEQEQLLLELLFKQQYALEIVSSHMTDIEKGLINVNSEQYEEIVSLYDCLRDEYASC
ncbi:antirepressor AbbA [Priestia megaterium]|nr:antirepressor AbbA [Priestia megaterium]